MFAIVSALLGALVAAFRPRADLVVEILVLRQQLAVLKHRRLRPRLHPRDRAFWLVVSPVRSRWADTLAIVKPDMVIAWHRRGFARFWSWKSRRIGRPPLSPEVVALIVRMARENPPWSRRHYKGDRPHMSLLGDTPTRRDVEPPSIGRAVGMARLDGPHHRYRRVAA